MKKLSILFTVLVVLVLPAKAQRGITLGVSGAPSAVFIVKQNNYETLDGCPVISRSELDYATKWGYNLGGLLGFNFNKRMGLQLGLRYVRTGQNYEDTFSPGTQFCPTPYHVRREVDLRYFRIPLMYRYKMGFKGNDDFKLYAALGPYVGWLLTADETVVINDVARTDLTPAYDKFNHFDVGISFGIGGEYFITKSLFLSLGLASDFGIKDMNGSAVKDEEWFSKNDVGYQKSHNFNLGLNVGIHYVFNPGAQNPFRKKTGDDASSKAIR